MDFFELIERRYSVRAYSDHPVEEEKLRKILRAAQVAPTAANLQPFRLLVRETRGCHGDLGRLYHREWFCQAPLVVGVCSVPRKAGCGATGRTTPTWTRRSSWTTSCSPPTALGLGTCWIAAFDPAVARSVFDLPDGFEPLAFTPLGYPADQAPGRAAAQGARRADLEAGVGVR